MFATGALGTSDVTRVRRPLKRLRSALLFGTFSLACLTSAHAQDSDHVTLSNIIVEGDEEVVTEGSDSYISPRVTVGRQAASGPA